MSNLLDSDFKARERVELAVREAIAALSDDRSWEVTLIEGKAEGRVSVEVRMSAEGVALTSVGVDDGPNAIAERLRLFVKS